MAATLVALVICFTAREASAQVQIASGPSLGVRGFFVPYEWQRMTATETFDAVLGTPTVTAFGGGADILNIAGGLFARVGIAFTRTTGERVFIVDDDVSGFDPPIVLTLTMVPIEVGAGWRFTPRPRAGGSASRVVPYVAGGLLVIRFSESTEFDPEGEGGFENLRGYFGAGGIEFGLGGGLIAGGEVQYRIVPDGLGGGGVSAHFGETDLGGVVLRLLVGFRK